MQRTVTANNTIIDEQAATIADLLEKNRKLAQNSWKATSRAKAKVAAAIPSATEMKKEHHAMAAIRRLQSLSSQTIAQQQEHISELQGLIVIDAQVNEELRAKLMAAELSCAQLTGQLSEVEARVKAAEAALTQRVSSAERNFTDKFKEASGTYTKEIRQVYYELLGHHASTAHATDMVVSVLSIFGGMDRDQLKKRLPSHKTVRRFLLEMGELANIQLGDCLCRLPMACLNHDGTTLGQCHIMNYFLTFDKEKATELGFLTCKLDAGTPEIATGSGKCTLDGFLVQLDKIRRVCEQVGMDGVEKAISVLSISAANSDRAASARLVVGLA